MKRLLLLLALLLAGTAHATSPLPGDSVYQLAVPLTDQDGHTAAFAARRGTPQIVSMFYTSCTMVCPMIIDTMKATRRAAGEPARLHLLAVSFDPARDSVDALRRYAAAHKLDQRWWTLARTAPQDTRSLAALLGVQYRPLRDGEFNHSSALLLLDGEGRIVARTDVIGRTDPAFVAAVRKAAGSK
ncbi:SCO family protein [Frateuria terrea]|uniref:Protein SCO1/2 n=1 Tax=Frateuria terrea TaxID=529704 RepID=A0A1H6VIC0_9GAMM|nr:SCO family protein [Frateuria terrea]SEJ04419.1 protein SCO1/2 [Frateuria terrea]SFP63339.1 protein SCO1/2 [Frateuria terrea]